MSKLNVKDGLQIGGAPVTDFIIENESSYIKFYDGTAICWGYVGISSGQNISVSFPLNFSATPAIAATWVNTTTTDTKEWNIYSQNETGFTLRKNSSHSNANGVSYVAIGQW